jgi:hypothetical protein
LSAQSTVANDTPALWVLQGSHYAERVLWAAELTNWPLRVRVFAPGPHVWALRRAAPQLRATHLPVLMAPQLAGSVAHTSSAGVPVGAVATVGALQGSGAILDHIGWPALRGAEAALQQALVQTLGPVVRQVFYAALCQQTHSAQAWAEAAYAHAPAALRAVAQHWPRATMRALLWREGVRAAQLPALLQALPAMAAPHEATARATLAALREGPGGEGAIDNINSNSIDNTDNIKNIKNINNTFSGDGSLCTGTQRLALTAGALLGPLLLPLPALWPTPPWPPALRAQLQALQRLPLWQLAHAAWAHRAACQTQNAAGDS